MKIFKWIGNNIIDSHVIINVITFSGLAAIFISIFFFTYAGAIEQEIVVDQANIVVNDLMQTINPLLTPAQKEQMKTKLVLPDNSHEDLHSLNSNNKLMSEAYSQLLIIFGVCMGVSLLLCIIFKHNYFKIIGLNLLLLVFIGLTELIFLHFIPKNYIIADTNWVRWKILSEIKTKIIFSDGTVNTNIPPSIQAENDAILQAINNNNNNLGNYASVNDTNLLTTNSPANNKIINTLNALKKLRATKNSNNLTPASKDISDLYNYNLI
jgi:hypothetical protein